MALPALLTQILIDNPLALWALTDPAGSTSAADINPTEFGPTFPGTPANVTFGAAGPVSGLTAASFNGSSSDVSIPYSSFLAPSGPWSIEVMFNCSSLPSANAGLLEARLSTTAGMALLLSSGGALLGLVGQGAGQTQLTGPTVGTGGWHIACLTYDGAAARLLMDGTLRVGPTTMTYARNSSQAIHLGRNIGGAIFFNGLLAFGSMYNYRLLDSQHANHYNAWQQAASEYYLPFPTGFQPWDVAGFGSIDAWYTENYQGGGFGQLPPLRQDVIVGLVAGSPPTKYWALPSAVNPLG